MPLGFIVSAEKDRYFVHLNSNEGFSRENRIQCQGRGVFREKGIIPMVGDRVEVVLSDEDEGIIVDILERKNELIRPPVANIDQVLILQSIEEPKINALSMDKLLLAIEKRDLAIIICFNKIDLIEDQVLEEWNQRYRKAGYKVLNISASLGKGVDELNKELQGKITAIAGPSGAGKSTFIRYVTGDESVQIGELSEKTSRGKQTTRNIELYQIAEDSFIFDTPGFSSLNLKDFESGLELAQYFPEIDYYKDQCKFRNCTHRKEPGCQVREEVETGQIDSLRYENYLYLFEEVEANRPY